MATVETWYTQDFNMPIHINVLTGNVFSADNYGSIIGVKCYRAGQPAPLSGSVSAMVVRPDGATVGIVGTLEGNMASVALPYAACSVPGNISVGIQLTSGTTTTTLCMVVATVYKSSTDTAVDPGTIIPSVSALIAEIEETAATIPQDYTELSNTVDDIERYLNNAQSVSPSGWVVGSLTTGTGEEAGNSSRVRSPYLGVSAGDTFTLSGGAECLIVYQFDANKAYISDSVWTDGNTFIVTNGTAYVRVLIRKSSSNPTISASEIAAQVARLTVYRVTPPGVYSYDADMQSIADQIALAQPYQRGGYNYLSRAMMTNGQYYASSTTISTAAGYATFETEIPAGTYHVRNLYGAFTYFIYGGTVTKLADMAGMQTGWNTGTVTLATPCTVHGTGRDTTSIFYSGLATNYPVKNAEVGAFGQSDIIEVGTGLEFDSIRDAVEYAQNFYGVTVNVHGGAYDMVSEWSASELAGMTTEEEHGLFLCHNNRYLFSPNARVTFDYTGNNGIIKKYFSPFNLLIGQDGGFTLEGLNLRCSNCRYAIHDEASGHDVTVHNVYRRCNLYIDNRYNSEWHNQQLIGGGLAKNSDILIEDCTFVSADTAGMVTYHNGILAGSFSNIVFRNNYMNGIGRFEGHYYGNSTDVTKCIVTGNSMGREPAIVQESASYTNVNMGLVVWNNEIRQ